MLILYFLELHLELHLRILLENKTVDEAKLLSNHRVFDMDIYCALIELFWTILNFDPDLTWRYMTEPLQEILRI